MWKDLASGQKNGGYDCFFAMKDSYNARRWEEQEPRLIFLSFMTMYHIQINKQFSTYDRGAVSDSWKEQGYE